MTTLILVPTMPTAFPASRTLGTSPASATSTAMVSTFAKTQPVVSQAPLMVSAPAQLPTLVQSGPTLPLHGTIPTPATTRSRSLLAPLRSALGN